MAFPDTRWTLVLRARGEGLAAPPALQELLRAYWRPIYVCFRSRGATAEDAEELTQELLTELFAGPATPELDASRGRFRSWLKACATHHHLRWLESGRAAKRGGGMRHVEIDADAHAAAIATTDDPGEAFDRAWAAGVMGRALHALRAEYESGERVGSWATLAPFFGGDANPSYREAASAAGMSLPQFKAFVHRGRQRFREHVALAVRDTVGSAEDAEAEVDALFRALA
jgi:DNA-directed RNA polymerase specialized sigma24 family protein